LSKHKKDAEKWRHGDPWFDRLTMIGLTVHPELVEGVSPSPHPIFGPIFHYSNIPVELKL